MLEGSVSHAWVTHLVVRGTYLPGTARCVVGDRFRPPPYLRSVFPYSVDPLFIKCYVDIRANSYVIGSGSPTFTALVFKYSYWDDEYTPMLEYGQTEQNRIEEIRHSFEIMVNEFLPGREHVLFLGPPVDISSEAWRSIGYWDVQRREDDSVIAVHPARDLWRDLRPDDFETYRSSLEMELPAFTQALTAAHEARVAEYGGRIGADTSLPMLVTDVNQLRQYYTAVGAYTPGSPTPVQPPPPCGLAVANQDDNPGLMRDCVALLAAKDTLAGSAVLDWGVDSAITGWEGVTAAGTPSRVTKLLLSNESLSGSIPAELGDLSELTHLNLSSNSLTGEIPRELGGLSNLQEIRLSGNSLTGCIPPGLKDVSTNDLNSLNLLYCPPATGGLTAGTAGENSVPLSWTAVANASKYRVEYRDAYYKRWTVDDETITGTTHTVSGLSCRSGYQFRVMAYGDGTTHAVTWSAPSAPVAALTGRCVPPTFGAASYSFSLPGDADVGSVVGSVSATGSLTDDTVTYSITAGDEDRNFAIDESTGRITVAGDLSSAVGTSFSLTVEAADTSGGSATVIVTVRVIKT